MSQNESDSVPWLFDVLVSLIAYLLLAPTTSVSNSQIERLLLRHFPSWSRKWTFTGKHSSTTRLQRWQARLKWVACAIPFLPFLLVGARPWQCVGLTFVAFAALELGIVCFLQILVWHLSMVDWIMTAAGWMPMQLRVQHSVGAFSSSGSDIGESDESDGSELFPMETRAFGTSVGSWARWSTKSRWTPRNSVGIYFSYTLNVQLTEDEDDQTMVYQPDDGNDTFEDALTEQQARHGDPDVMDGIDEEAMSRARNRSGATNEYHGGVPTWDFERLPASSPYYRRFA